ncbi:POK9 protein, partial [Toxostoma redivivum]|nr:POK9 protein [Toxostoma redivivum]
SGSLTLDLATAVDITLIDKRPQKIPTGITGPLIIAGQAHGALLLGQSSASMKGLFVLPGVIDANYKGEICIMVQTQFPPMHIPKGSKVTQLVLMMQLTAAMNTGLKQQHREGGFGSTGGLALLTLSMDNRPVVWAVLQCSQHSMHLPVLLDPGSDLTIM